MHQILTPILQTLAILIAGLVAGSIFGIWRGYDPAGYSATTFLEVHQGAVRGLNVLLPVMGFATIAMTAALAFLSRGQAGILSLYLLALLGFAAAGLITRFLNQPINAEIMGWTSATMPADWEAIRDRWWVWHQARLATTIFGLVSLIVAVLRGAAAYR